MNEPAVTQDRAPATRRKRRKVTERGYLNAVINAISTRDVAEVAARIVEDAKGGDERCRNAAREWIGKYIMGGGNVRPSDVHCPPVVRKSR